MNNIPTKIYLQVGTDETDIDFNDLTPDGAVSWCSDKIEDTDIPYLKEETVMEVFRWLLGYSDFPINEDGKSPYYWRPELRKKMAELGIEFKPPTK
jgi:hypothetical protein